MGVFNQLLIEKPWSNLNKADTWLWGLPSLFSECRPHFYMWSEAAWPDLSLFILASDLPFFPFNFLLASCAVCLSFLVPLLVLTQVLHSDPSSFLPQRHPASLVFSCLGAPFSIPCTYWGLWPGGMLPWGEHPFPLWKAFLGFPGEFLFLVYTVSLFLNSILSISNCSFL